MKTKLILLILTALTQSCVIMLNEDEFTNERTDYTGNSFRLDGCYVHNLNCNGGEREYNFFYRNGILLTFWDSCNVENVSQFKLYPWVYNGRGNWQIFHVENNKINVKYWTQIPNLLKLETATYTFTIINDTTLSVLDTEGKPLFYYFKKFVSKPDSINKFIK